MTRDNEKECRRRRLEGHAALLLESLGCKDGPYVVTVRCAGESHEYAAPWWMDPPPCEGCARQGKGCGAAQPAPAPCPPEGLPAGALWLSPLERKIVDGLRGNDWVVTAELAASIGEEPSSEFRAVVRNLAERGILETNTRLGVRLSA